jgi:1-acyl-sn-glycerol-3-phosphate acyltransferase
MLRTLLTYAGFVLGALVLTVIGLLIRVLPFGRKRLKLFYHTLLAYFTRSLIYLGLDVKKKIINRSPGLFDRASIIISNHTSFLDILLTVHAASKAELADK